MKIPHSYECPGSRLVDFTPFCQCGAAQREEDRIWSAIEALEAELEVFYIETGKRSSDQRVGDELV